MLILQVIPIYPEYALPGEQASRPLPEGPEGYTLFHSQIVEDVDAGPILYLLWVKNGLS